MKNNYTFIFDMDGTLCMSRENIPDEIGKLLIKLTETNKVVIVSGASKARIIQQVPEYLLPHIEYYGSMGNEGIPEATISEEEYQEVQNLMKANCGYELYFQHKGSSICASFAPNTDMEARQEFAKLDAEKQIRLHLAKKLMDAELGKKYDFLTGGRTSLDITKKGFGKQRVVKMFENTIFIGDNCVPFGNDYAGYRAATIGIKVNNWEHTMEVLQIFLNMKPYKQGDYVERPWGSYTNLFTSNNLNVKRLVIKPDCRTSLQRHYFRQEIMTVPETGGEVLIKENTEYYRPLHKDHPVVIPAGCWHQIINNNNKDLVIIEVQQGLLSEDDIVRWE